MKTTKEPAVFTVKAIRGFAGEGGKPVKVGATITCKSSVARVLVSCGKGEIVESGAKS